MLAAKEVSAEQPCGPACWLGAAASSVSVGIHGKSCFRPEPPPQQLRVIIKWLSPSTYVSFCIAPLPREGYSKGCCVVPTTGDGPQEVSLVETPAKQRAAVQPRASSSQPVYTGRKWEDAAELIKHARQR